MGLDIRVDGIIGVPAKAVADGYISRIKVKPSGYGRAVYLTLSDGKVAVYAHMDSFAPEIQNYVLDQQWTAKSYSVDLYPPADKFVYKQGEVVAFSGRAGTRHAHLHFELRKNDSVSLNPLNHGLSIKDSRSPVIKSVALIPLTADSELDGDCRPKIYNAINQGNGVFRIDAIPGIFGEFGISINADDFTDDAPQPISPFHYQLILNGEEKFDIIFDECDYYSYLQVEVDRDSYLKRKGFGKFQRLFKIEGNKLPFYTGDGVIRSQDLVDYINKVNIIVEDVYGNSAEVDFQIEKKLQPDIPRAKEVVSFNQDISVNQAEKATPPEYDIEFFKDWIRIQAPESMESLFWLNGNEYEIGFTETKHGKIGRIKLESSASGWNFLYSPEYGVLDKWNIAEINPKSSGIVKSPDGKFKVEFHPDGVYEKFYAAIQPVDIKDFPAGYEYVENTGYRLDPQWIPLKRIAELKWTVSDSSSQVGIYYLDARRGPTFLGNRRHGNQVIGSCLNLETFVLVRDIEFPDVRLLSHQPGITINSLKPDFTFEISDSLSGIDNESIMVTIDGEWVLAEYDPPRKIVHVLLRNGLEPGQHEISFSVKDNSGNLTEKSYVINLK